MITQKVDLYSDSESEADRGEVQANLVWKGREFPIYEGENIVGREDDCDIVLDHESVSLKHAVLDYEEGIAKMRDLKSKNGTSVESAVGSGAFVKLGPNRRNEVVNPGCIIRFGLVDCKFSALPTANAHPTSSNLKIDCETQFINMAPMDDDDDDSEEEEVLPVPTASSIQRLAPRGSITEQDTQVNASLTSAEKAPTAAGPSSPDNYITDLVGTGSHRTPIISGIASVGIGYGHSPSSDGTAESPAFAPGRTASSKGSPSPAKPALLYATSTSPNGTDIDEETEDEGGIEQHEDAEEERLGAPAAPRVPDLNTTLIADSAEDSDGSEMSQDLLRGEDAEPEHVAVEAVDGVHAKAADESDEEGDFNFAQREQRTAESIAPPADAHVSYHSAPVRANSVDELPASPFHELGSAYFTADTHPHDVYPDEPYEPVLPAITEVAPADEEAAMEVVPSVVAPVETELSGNLAVSTASSNGGVRGSTSSAVPSRSTTMEAEAGRRSPGGAIQQLLQQSGMQDGARVFNTQGEILGAVELTASPRLSSRTSSYPVDAPPLNFDFAAAAVAAPVAATAPAAKQQKDTSATEIDEGDEEEDEVVVTRPHRSASVQAGAAPKSARKRVLESPEPEHDADLTAGATADPQVETGNKATSAAKERNVRARKTRSNDPGDLGEPLPVVTEVPFSQPSPVKKTPGKRRRFLDDEDSDAEAPEPPVVPPALVPPAAAAAAAAAAEAPKATAGAKKGRGKAAAVVAEAPEEEAPDAADENVLSAASAVTKTGGAKKARGKASTVASADLPAQEPEATSEEIPTAAPASAAAAAAVKKGRGKQRADDVTADTAVPPVPEVAVSTLPAAEEPVPVKAATKKAGKKTAAEPATNTAEEVLAPAPVAAEELSKPTAVAKKTAKKAAAASAPDALQEPVVAPEPAPEPPAIEAAPAKKATAKKASAAKAEKAETSPASAKTAEPKPAAASAEAEVHPEVRIMFTKVDEGPYAKVLKGLPNVTIVADACQATHCITLPELKRTPKLMVAINCGAQYVLSEQWAKDCVKAKGIVEVFKTTDATAGKKGKAAPTKNLDPRVDLELYQRLAASPYLVTDPEKEKLWGFSMAATLAIPRNQPGAPQLFAGLCFFCTKGVCGETAPPADELCAIIESGGGRWLTSLEEWADLQGPSTGTGAGAAKSKGGKGKSAASESAAEGQALVVLSHPNVMKKEVTKKVLEALEKCTAPGAGVYSMELVFLACLRQRLDFEESKLK